MTMETLHEGGFLITKIHHLSGRIFSKKLREYGIKIHPGQGRILFALWKSDGIPVNELAKRTLLGKSTLTTMLDRLVDQGFVRRVPSERDRRVILIELTEKNRQLQDKYIQVSQEMTDLFYQGFSSSEIDEFETTLRRLLTNLVEYEDE